MTSHTAKPRAAIAVLGKMLAPPDRVTVDFAMRLAGLFYALAKAGDYSTAVFVGGTSRRGGRAEAVVGHEVFQQRFLPRLPTEAVQFEFEDRSRDTIENVANLAGMLAGRDFSRVDLISTDFHIDRLETIDRLLPDHSLLRPLDGHRRRLLRVPYFFARDVDPQTRLKADVFAASDSLSLARVNLQAIAAGTSGAWQAEIERRFAASLATLQRLVRRAEFLPMDSRFNERLQPAVAALHTLSGAIHTLVASGASGRVQHQTAATLIQRITAAIDTLREVSDVDRPVRADDWPQIEHMAHHAIAAQV